MLNFCYTQIPYQYFDIGIDFLPRLEILKVEEPAVRSGGRKVADVDELINVLKDEVGII